jgi:hypothetical protein
MSRPRKFVVSVLVSLAGLAAMASSASAQAETQRHGSCAGVLSAFAGSQRDDEFFRQDFAPLPGDVVASIAQDKGLLADCATGIPGLP